MAAASPSGEAATPGRRGVVRDALAVGAATGAYGVSFGAVAVAAGLSVPQACAMSLLMFTGASQFAFVGVVGAGGNPFAGVATAVLLGLRNAFYGLRLSSLLGLRGARRLLGAQVVIDESTAMAVGRDDDDSGRLAFWATGASVFVLWNLATLAGGLGARAVADPRVRHIAALLPVALLATLVATQTLSTGHRLVLDARAAGVAVAVAARLLRAPFLVVVVAAAATTALIRLAT